MSEQTVTRQHLAGLQLALESGAVTCPDMQESLQKMIAQASAAPEVSATIAKPDCSLGWGHSGHWCGPKVKCWLDPRSRKERDAEESEVAQLRADLRAAQHPVSGEQHPEFFVDHAILRKALGMYGISAPESDHELGSRMESYAIKVIKAVAKLPFPEAHDVSDIEAMVTSLENREWADHIGVSPLGQRLESAITDLFSRQQGVMELRLCEQKHTTLKPNRTYRFTVDPACPACVEMDAAQRTQQGEQP